MVISIPSYEQSLGIPRLEHESSTLYISSNYTVKVDALMLCYRLMQPSFGLRPSGKLTGAVYF